MLYGDFFKRMAGYLVTVISSVFVFLPVLGGIISTMIALIGVSYGFVYVFWQILGGLTIIPFSTYNSYYYFQGYIKIGDNLSYIVLFFSMILFITGIFLFITGMMQITSARIHQISIVQTYLYKYIRHPQNAGIILIAIAFFMYIPTTWTNITGPGKSEYLIRIGDFYSLSMFILIWLIEVTWEEYNLVRKYGKEYIQYQNTTPCLIPFSSKWTTYLTRKLPKILTHRSYTCKVFLYFVFYFLYIICFSILIGPFLYFTK